MTMKNTFTLGAIAGIATLTLVVPLLVQVSSAASGATVPTGSTTPTISQSAAEQTALAAHPGTLSEATHLNARFGGYKVEVTGLDGNEYDVIVDSTTGAISQSWIDGQGGPKGGCKTPPAQDQSNTQNSTSSL